MKLADTYAALLAQEDANYFLSLDQTYFNEYNRALNAYVIYLIQQDLWTSGNRTSQVSSAKSTSLSALKKGILLVKNRDLKYVTKYYRSFQKVTVFRTTATKYKTALRKVENKIIPKLYRLRSSNTITETKYLTALQNYNAYILNFSISSVYPNSIEARKRYQKAYASMIATYNKKIILGKTTPVTSPTTPSTGDVVPTPKTVGDYYTFSRDLKE